jgi:hypothetical protein
MLPVQHDLYKSKFQNSTLLFFKMNVIEIKGKHKYHKLDYTLGIRHHVYIRN